MALSGALSSIVNPTSAVDASGLTGLSLQDLIAYAQASRAPDYSREIAELQQSAETGRTQYTTEASARAGAATLASSIVKSMMDSLAQIGLVAPSVSGASDPQAAQTALVEALRTGAIQPTVDYKKLLAEAAQNPANTIRMLALTAGLGEPQGDLANLASRTSFDTSKLAQEELSSRGTLAGQLEKLPVMSFQQLLDLLMPKFAPGVMDITPDAAAAADAAASASTPAGGETLQQMAKRLGIPKKGGGTAKGQTATPTPAPGGSSAASRAYLQTAKQQFLQAQQELSQSGRTKTFSGGREISGEVTVRNRWRDYLKGLSDAQLNALAADDEVMKNTPVAGVSELINRKLRGQNLLGEDVIGELGARARARSRASFRKRRGRSRGAIVRLKLGDLIASPGYFLLGEGKRDEGVKAGTAEFAYLAPGSVIAPMVPGEKPDMDTAQRAVAEMIVHGGRRTKPTSSADGNLVNGLAPDQIVQTLQAVIRSAGGQAERPRVSSPVPRAQSGVQTYIVQPGETLWSIAQRFLGSGARWPELLGPSGLPPDFNPAGIAPGTTLVIPGNAAAATSAAPAGAAQPLAAIGSPTAATSAEVTGQGPAEKTKEETAQGIRTEAGPGGLLSQLLREGRNVSDILRGLTLKPAPGTAGYEALYGAGANIDPYVRNIVEAPGTRFPLMAILGLPETSRNALLATLGSLSGDVNIPKNILDLQQALRSVAFGGPTLGQTAGAARLAVT